MKPGFMVNTKLNVVLSVNYPVRFFLPPSIKVQVRFTILWLNPFPTFLTMAFPNYDFVRRHLDEISRSDRLRSEFSTTKWCFVNPTF